MSLFVFRSSLLVLKRRDDVGAHFIHVQRLELRERSRHGEKLDDGFLRRLHHERTLARLPEVNGDLRFALGVR